MVLVAAAVFVPAVWRNEVVNDEMYHLPSWRNRYGEPEPLPIFRVRLEQATRLSPDAKDRLLDLYLGSRLFQNLLFIQSDPASLGHSMLAEVVRIITGGSLVGLRLPSLLAALASLVLAFRIGRDVRDPMTGMCVSAMFALSPLLQVYAGVGRSHALAQCAVLLLLHVFIRARQGRLSLHAVLGACLLVQFSHWAAWALVFPVLTAELICRLRMGVPVFQLFGQTWWYATASVLLLGAFYVQNYGTAAMGNMNLPEVSQIWQYFCVACPFGHLNIFGTIGMGLAGAGTLLLICSGLVSQIRRPPRHAADREIGCTLVAAMAAAGISMFLMCGQRHLMVYVTPFAVAAGIGLSGLLRMTAAGGTGLAAMISVFGIASACFPEDPYKYVLENEVPYSQVAEALKAELGEGDVWTACPYFFGNCLYRYGPLPEPFLPFRGYDEYQMFLRKRPADRNCFVLTNPSCQDIDPAFRLATFRRDFGYGRLVLLKLPPTGSPVTNRGGR